MNQESREDPEPEEDLGGEPRDKKAEATPLHRTCAQQQKTPARSPYRDGDAAPARTCGWLDRESPDEDGEITGERRLGQRA